jgi:hypothetical protein
VLFGGYRLGEALEGIKRRILKALLKEEGEKAAEVSDDRA